MRMDSPGQRAIEAGGSCGVVDVRERGGSLRKEENRNTWRSVGADRRSLSGRRLVGGVSQAHGLEEASDDSTGDEMLELAAFTGRDV